MKHLSLLMISASALSLAGCNSSELDFRNAQFSNGKIYESNANKPFTGILMNMPENSIRLANDFNGFLMNYNQSMQQSKVAENLLIGRYLVCNSETKDGYLSGQLTCYTPNSTIKRYTAEYNAGNLNGKVNIYAPDGATLLAKTNFKNDKRDGKTEIYGPHTGKLIAEYHIINGQADGEQTSWNESTGKMTYHVSTKNGSYVGSMQTWTADGVLTADVPFVNGMKNGLVKTWHENGKPMNFVTMMDGYRDGPSNSWDEHGNLISSGMYKREIWWPDAAPKSKELSVASSGDDSCAIKWIDAFHKANGEDAMINNEQLGEWDQWCTEGKLPN